MLKWYTCINNRHIYDIHLTYPNKLSIPNISRIIPSLGLPQKTKIIPNTVIIEACILDSFIKKPVTLDGPINKHIPAIKLILPNLNKLRSNNNIIPRNVNNTPMNRRAAPNCR